jgi:hypothetical protein
MKRIYFSFLLFAVSSQVASAQEEEIPIDHIFARGDMTNNEQAAVMVSGWLPSACYNAPRAEVTRQNRAIIIKVKATPDLSVGSMCIAVAVPFLIAVPLGMLAQGRYDVQDGSNDDGAKTTLQIYRARPAPWIKPLYARVEQVKFDARRQQLVLSGRNPSDCLRLDHVNLSSNGRDTYTVTPIMKLVGGACPRKLVRFEYRVSIPRALDADQILYYVRSLDVVNNFVTYLQTL